MTNTNKNIILSLVVIVIALIAVVGYKYSLKHQKNNNVNTLTTQSRNVGQRITAAPGSLVPSFPNALVPTGVSSIKSSVSLIQSHYSETTSEFSTQQGMSSVQDYYTNLFKQKNYKVTIGKGSSSMTVLDAVNAAGIDHTHIVISSTSTATTVVVTDIVSAPHTVNQNAR
jgi:hypothetical protein